MQEYDEFQKTLDKNGVNEINFIDKDARTVKFGAHQGNDIGYNIKAAVDTKNKLITKFEVINISIVHKIMLIFVRMDTSYCL